MKRYLCKKIRVRVEKCETQYIPFFQNMYFISRENKVPIAKYYVLSHYRIKGNIYCLTVIEN
jgi:hypothetical protein